MLRYYLISRRIYQEGNLGKSNSVFIIFNYIFEGHIYTTTVTVAHGNILYITHVNFMTKYTVKN